MANFCKDPGKMIKKILIKCPYKDGSNTEVQHRAVSAGVITVQLVEEQSQQHLVDAMTKSK